MGVRNTSSRKQGAKNKSTKGVDLARITSLLDEADRETRDAMPEGETIMGFAEAAGISRAYAYEKLSKLVRTGKMTRVKYGKKYIYQYV